MNDITTDKPFKHSKLSSRQKRHADGLARDAMADENRLSPQEIGRRLRLTRENAGIRQGDAAQAIGISRPTLVSIENGTRHVRIRELQMLARCFDISVNRLMRRESIHTDLVPRFRKLRSTDDKDKRVAVELFSNLIKADVELENLLGISHPRNYPQQPHIDKGNIDAVAEEHAQELRHWLGLGAGPVANIFSVIEFGLGIRLYQRHLFAGSRVAGLFAYDEQVGACIFLNANHAIQLRTQSAAHELGHFYGTRRMPEVLEDGNSCLSRDERYANAFGRAFLTPRNSFSESFYQLKDMTGEVTQRLIVLLAHQYKISCQACCCRLEELNLAKKGTWDWFERNGGITKEHIRSVVEEASDCPDPAKNDAKRLVSYRMCLMVHAVWKRMLMSEGSLAELLGASRLDIRKIVDEIEIEEGEENGLFKHFDRKLKTTYL